MNKNVNEAYHFHNKQVDGSIISHEQILNILTKLSEVIENNIDGDIVELGCYVGESSKYIRKLLDVYESKKTLTVYDSFEGLPPLSKWEEKSGWKPFTLKTSQDILIQNFKNNDLIPPKIVKGWFKDIKEEDLPEKISFAFLDGDFYDSIYDSLVKIYDRMSDGGVIMFHDFRRPDLPGVDAAIIDFFKERNINYNVIEICNQLGYYQVNKKNSEPKHHNTHVTTLVTGLWDIKRGKLSEGWARGFEEHYLEHFKNFLKIPNNLIIFGDSELKKFVEKNKTHDNVQFIERSLSWFNNEFFQKIQNIRKDSQWLSQSGWLSNSTQAKLEYYNPLVMQKMFLLNDASIMDRFNSDYLFWIDAGLTNTVHPGYFTHDNILDKLPNKISNFHFISFPYDGKVEIHGFEYQSMCRLSGQEVDMVCRGGFFGGKKEIISEVNGLYYSLMDDTLSRNLMGTEESLFTILTYKYPELFTYSKIESNGLVSKFFEDLKNDTVVIENKNNNIIIDSIDTNKVGLYVIGFNSPKQFETLITSMLSYDSDFIDKPEKFLLNNSTDLTTTPEYKKLCEKYGFTHIKKDNLGICGGRQWIAEHFDNEDLESMFFFEDDMFFYPKKGEVCKNGFNRYISKLYTKSLSIVKKENFDFLKLNYTEFFGDNGTQWSWYNVPQDFRETNWPNKKRLPEIGLDPNSPRTKFNNIRTHNDLPYIDGEIYYCNWPQLVTKKGNKKMFLTEKWGHPFEQTWMSYIYQETIKNNVKPGLLLLTPTEHDRFDHYDKNLRKES